MLIVVLKTCAFMGDSSKCIFKNRVTACCPRRRKGMNWINVAWNRDKLSGFCEICNEPSGFVQWKGM